MNSMGYIGIAFILLGLFGLAIIGLGGGLRGLLETYVWQSLFLAGLTIGGVFLLWLNSLFPNERPRQGM